MIEIRNLMFQPLTFHLIGDERSIHLNARERRLVSPDEVSDELRAAASRGFVSLTEVSGSTQPDPRVETAEREYDVDPASEDRVAARQRKRRQV